MTIIIDYWYYAILEFSISRSQHCPELQKLPQIFFKAWRL